MTIQQAEKSLHDRLVSVYDPREASVIAGLVMEKLTGWTKVERILRKSSELSADQQETFARFAGELMASKPVQYVLGEAWFCGMRFLVDERVLIPRPETEELVGWVIQEIINRVARTPSDVVSMLDVGTGSGCIAIALKKKLPSAVIYACDISETALQVARTNARHLKTEVHFLAINFLDAGQRRQLPPADYIISNPPYIPLDEKESLPYHVAGFEPHLALFVPEKQPLLFYEALAEHMGENRTSGVELFAELHENLTCQAAELFKKRGFPRVDIRKDLYGKERMIRVTR
jgi:release factor glutamine methyltransferase